MYKQWLDNEYQQWIKALQESTVDNFWTNPVCQRMLGADFVFNMLRMVIYAQNVLKQNPPSIVEIGGGVGQFYAILRALGYQGDYYIFDIPEVKEFQNKYLERVTELTGLNTRQQEYFFGFNFCVSFYALGEFDDDLKHWYIENVVKKCEHGLIIWNPHSGASKHVPFACNIEPEYPLTNPDNKLLTW